YHHIDDENLDIHLDLIKFLKNSLDEKKYPLFWILSSDQILSYWKNDIISFYESYPVDYEEDKGTYLTSVPNTLLCTTRVNDEEYFGSITNAYWIKAHKNIVCKTLRNLEDINSKYYSVFIQELTMQTRIDLCENIIRFLGISKDISTSSICIFNYISKLINYAIDIDNQYCLIMDYANNRNLWRYLEENNHSLNWGQRLKLGYQISNRLYYLHSEEIIYRDLHDKNIVIHNRNTKITDFGMLKVHYLKIKLYLCYRIIDGMREDIITGTSEEYWKLYCKCWDADPNKRPDIEYVYDALHKLLGIIENNYSSILSMKYKVTQNLVVQIEDARYCTNIQASGLDKLTIEIRTAKY
ncbi:9978_t:CDS:2, partial [Gigaspora margarita]